MGMGPEGREWADHKRTYRDFGVKLSVTSGGGISLLRMLNW